MLDSRGGRTVGVVVLLVVLVGVCLAYGSQTAVQTQSTLPDTDDVGYDSGRYVGDLVEVSGVVINTDPVVIAAQYNYYDAGERHGGVLILTVRGVSQPVAERETLQGYGVLDSPDALTAENVVVTSAGNFLYMYAVSFLAGLWVLGRLLTHWQFDPATFAITKRPSPLSVREFLQPTDAQEES